MLQVRYFANIRETLGLEHELVPLPPGATVAALILSLTARHGARWQQLAGVAKVLTAVNHEVVPHDTIIKDGDEVAFFPPVTGG
ncbi:MAG TPA: molybdopterin converting factor subunit 1 [Candidatus Acidoferrum sp.]|nr:molybdopterin converting factor subunit 1 [Candidatus Acidoferrum sp.]